MIREALENTNSQVMVELQFDNFTLTSDNIKTIEKVLSGSGYSTYMQQVDIALLGRQALGNKFKLVVKVDWSNQTYTKVLGTFYVQKNTITYSYEDDTTSFTAYDGMYKFHVVSDLSTASTMSQRDVVDTCANEFDINSTELAYINNNKVINDMFLNNLNDSKYTKRDILDAICQLNGVAMFIDFDIESKFRIVKPTDSGVIFDENNMSSASIGNYTGSYDTLKYNYKHYVKNDSGKWVLTTSKNTRTNAGAESGTIYFNNNIILGKKQKNLGEGDAEDNWNTTTLFNYVPLDAYKIKHYVHDIQTFGVLDFAPLTKFNVRYYDGIVYQCMFTNSIVSISGGGLTEQMYLDQKENEDITTYDYQQMQLNSNINALDMNNTEEINTRMLYAEKAEVGELVAQQISVADLDASHIKTGTLNASLIDTDSFNAKSATLFDTKIENLEVGSINGNAIKDSTILAKALSSGAIQTAKGNTVYYQATQPTTPKVGTAFINGDTWYKTVVGTDETYASNMYVYNGTTWVETPLDGDIIRANSITAQELNVDKLSAISSNLGDITGGSININNKFIVDSNGNIIATSGKIGNENEWYEITNNGLVAKLKNGTKTVNNGVTIAYDRINTIDSDAYLEGIVHETTLWTGLLALRGTLYDIYDAPTNKLKVVMINENGISFGTQEGYHNYFYDVKKRVTITENSNNTSPDLTIDAYDDSTDSGDVFIRAKNVGVLKDFIINNNNYLRMRNFNNSVVGVMRLDSSNLFHVGNGSYNTNIHGNSIQFNGNTFSDIITVTSFTANSTIGGIATNLAGGGNVSVTMNVEKSGYTPLGVVGFNTQNNNIMVRRLDLSGNTVTLHFRNVHASTTVATITPIIKVLYMKNI